MPATVIVAAIAMAVARSRTQARIDMVNQQLIFAIYNIIGRYTKKNTEIKLNSETIPLPPRYITLSNLELSMPEV